MVLCGLLRAISLMGVLNVSDALSKSDYAFRLHVVLSEHRDFVDSDFEDGILGFSLGQKMVGHGSQTRDSCGAYRKTLICADVEKHKQTTLDGVSHAGQVYYEKVRYWCWCPECPICWKKWLSREARVIEGRLSESSKRFGKVEHIVISVPQKDWHLGMKVLRRNAEEIAESLGIIGSCVVTHAFRYRPNHWYVGVHFHLLGHVLHGFGRCRNCEKRLKRACPDDCDGFNVRCNKERLRSGWIVKVARDRFGRVEERRSVLSTARYELAHATYEKVSKRVHVVSWTGVVSYRKLKWTPERKGHMCKLCGDEMVRAVYVGHDDFKRMNDCGWTDFLGADGKPQWIPINDGG